MTTTVATSDTVQVHKNVFSEDDIEHILTHDAVIDALHKMKLQNEQCIPFFIPMTDSIRTKLMDAFQLPSLGHAKLLPMRWVSGDTEEHNDVIPPKEWLESMGFELPEEHDAKFDFTHLVYLTNDATGKLVIGDAEYAIERNVGYKFCEGVKHRTDGCLQERLMVGPFTEEGCVCGATLSVYHNHSGGKKKETRKKNAKGNLAKKMSRTRRSRRSRRGGNALIFR
jgi:hypothetical protein